VQLTELDLDGTKTTDSGLAALSGLTNLRRLELVGTDITDGGIESLMRMTQVADADALSHPHFERRPRAAGRA
jgi:hypothetical protein